MKGGTTTGEILGTRGHGSFLPPHSLQSFQKCVYDISECKVNIFLLDMKEAPKKNPHIILHFQQNYIPIDSLEITVINAHMNGKRNPPEGSKWNRNWNILRFQGLILKVLLIQENLYGQHRAIQHQMQSKISL